MADVKDEVKDAAVDTEEVTEEEKVAEGDPGDEQEEKAEDEDDQPEDKEAPGEDDEEELSNKEAKILYAALKNPATRDATLRELAIGFGHKLETTKEVKEAKKGILEVLEKHLGGNANLGFLAKSLAPAIEELLESEREENKRELNRLEQVNIAKEVEGVMGDIQKSHKGDDWKAVEAKMVRLMDEMTPGANTSTSSYLKNLYHIATSGRAKASATTEIADKIRKNANDVGGRLTSQARGSDGAVKFDPNKKYSLNESVELAEKLLRQKAKK